MMPAAQPSRDTPAATKGVGTKSCGRATYRAATYTMIVCHHIWHLLCCVKDPGVYHREQTGKPISTLQGHPRVLVEQFTP